MTALRKSAVATALILAAALVYYQMRLTDNLHRQVSELKQQSTSVPAAASPPTQTMLPEEKLKQLEAANIALSNSLDQAKAVNANMNSAWLKAEQAYKELADKTAVSDPANRFPTARHLAAGTGSLMRRTMQYASQSKSADMTPEQIKAFQDEAIALTDESSALMKAGQSLSGKVNGGSSDSAVDSACMLYGALDLNEQQFNQAYSIIRGLRDQAKSRNLLGGKTSPENQAALAQWDQEAESQIQQILKPDQKALFRKMPEVMVLLLRGEGFGGVSIGK